MTTKRTTILLSLLVLLPFLLSSCGGISLLTSAEFLDNISPSDPDLSQLDAGTYHGSYTIVPPPGVMVANRSSRVEVSIVDNGGTMEYGEIRIIEPDQYREDSKFLALAARISGGTSLQVDQVSGATYSGMAILKAIEYAAVKGAGNE